MSIPKFTNDLIHESSPYLLQHAHNPVNWKAWNEETLLQARKENKLLLISIGYATCHWCHVMETESFENKEVASLMNQHFICVKIDREERPDVDQVYMDAVQLLTGRGGWPLNCIALHDGRPFWGGTYFPKKNWMGILTEINKIWEQEPDKILEYAENLTRGVQQKDLIPVQTEFKIINPQKIKNIINPWEKQFDLEYGGMNRAPKFPLPNNYHFLLRYAVQSGNQELLDFVQLTLTKMAFGGIYDHIRGGFSRYSTDIKWHVPHFEKMLYDNAQLVSLYSDAYLITKKPLYKEVVIETLQFIENELYDTKTGGFFTALDADSLNTTGEKEEGAYYYWTEAELQNILGTDFEIFAKYYNINPFGHWEHGRYVLIKNLSDESFVLQNNLDAITFQNTKKTWKQKLQKKQTERERPILDDKILTSWNALMLKGYADAYRVFGNPKYLEIAQKNADFLCDNLLRPDGGLNRNYKNGVSKINAYIEDYAAFIDALLSLHEVTLEEKYLLQAKALTDYTLEHFFDAVSGFFFFTSDEDRQLIHRKIDFTDNVISSGNSIMARNLFKMSHLFGNENYENISKKMLNNLIEHFPIYPSGYSNWLFLATDLATDFYEIVITGPQAKSKLKELHSFYLPNKLVTGTEKQSEMPLLENRYDKEQTRIFVCVNKICQLPTEDLTTALNLIKIHF